MREKILVSIVTPSLNRKDLLERVVRCIEEQTYPRIEHIVVDGGSTDGSVELLQTRRQVGLRWTSEPDEGIYNAVNKGFRMARGEVLAYLNTDDLYLTYSVACAVDAFEKDPDAGFVYGDMVRLDEEKGRASIVFHPPLGNASLMRGRIIGQPVVFWRKAVGDHLGELDETLKLAADHEYWRRMASSFKGHRVDDVLAYEGIHENRLTSGPEATRRGLEELELVRRRFDPNADDPRHRLVLDLWDRVLAAVAVRVLMVRFLLLSLRPREGSPGARWQGFFAQRRFKVRWKDSLAALLPFSGRPFERSTLEPLP